MRNLDLLKAMVVGAKIDNMLKGRGVAKRGVRATSFGQQLGTRETNIA